MVLKKIFLLWLQTYSTLVSTPIATWLGLIAMHMQRYYYALFKSGALMLVVPSIITIFYLKNTLFGVAATFALLSLIIFMMRPTVSLKNFHYLHDYFFLENSTRTGSIVLCYLVCATALPTIIFGVIQASALITFCFLYDTPGSIPDSVGYALLRTGYFVLYKAPLLAVVASLVSIINYGCVGAAGIFFALIIGYPLSAALITLVYINAVHDTYELYYAE